VYGLGVSHNDDRYLDEYKSFVTECANPPGKLINISKLCMVNAFSQSLTELTSNASTTISASSSLNSLNSYGSSS